MIVWHPTPMRSKEKNSIIPPNTWGYLNSKVFDGWSIQVGTSTSGTKNLCENQGVHPPDSLVFRSNHYIKPQTIQSKSKKNKKPSPRLWGMRCLAALGVRWSFLVVQVMDESGQSYRCDHCDGKGVALQVDFLRSLVGSFFGPICIKQIVLFEFVIAG